MNRKGDIDLLEWFPRIIMLIIAVLLIIFLVSFFMNRDIKTADAHISAYTFRMMTDAEIFTYADPEINRAYPGVIELSRFQTEHIDTVLNNKGLSQWGQISSEMCLISDNDCGVFGDTKSMVVYNNEETFKRYQPFTSTVGRGAANERTFRYPVTVTDGTERCSAVLRITVVRPNSWK